MSTPSQHPRKRRHLDNGSGDTTSTVARVPVASIAPNSSDMAEKSEVEKAFVARDEALRTTCTCKICFRMLYEPYTLGCGHTYCYSCLCQWLTSTERAVKTCPDCRAMVRATPAPAFGLREVVRELIQRQELLPDGETRLQHEKCQKEEAAMVEHDRLNEDAEAGGLFKGLFNAMNGFIHNQPLLDQQDGVFRCPTCNWELEGEAQYCSSCGVAYNEASGLLGESQDEGDWSDGSGELDGDLELDDRESDYDSDWQTHHLLINNASSHPRHARSGVRRHSHPHTSMLYEHIDGHSGVVPDNWRRLVFGEDLGLDEDESDPDGEDGSEMLGFINDEENEDEEHARSFGHEGQEDEEEDEEGEEEEDEDDDSSGDDQEEEGDDDDDSQSTTTQDPGYTPARGTRRNRYIIADSDDDDNEEDASKHTLSGLHIPDISSSSGTYSTCPDSPRQLQRSPGNESNADMNASDRTSSPSRLTSYPMEETTADSDSDSDRSENEVRIPGAKRFMRRHGASHPVRVASARRRY